MSTPTALNVLGVAHPPFCYGNNWQMYTILENEGFGGVGCPPPPPPIIFERLELPQQIIYRRKGNLSESPNHFKYRENILISWFYEQFSRSREKLSHELPHSAVTNQMAFNQRDLHSTFELERAMDCCCQVLISKLETLGIINFTYIKWRILLTKLSKQFNAWLSGGYIPQWKSAFLHYLRLTSDSLLWKQGILSWKPDVIGNKLKLTLKALGFLLSVQHRGRCFSPHPPLCKIRSRHPRELKLSGLIVISCFTKYGNLKAQQ